MGNLSFHGSCGIYHGYRQYSFSFDGCDCFIVEPKQPLPGREWVWKAEFFEACPTFDLAMLERGFYLAFISVGDTFGCPDALRHWSAFYRELTGKNGFAAKPVFLALSRGGLYMYNWAVHNTDKIGCLYGDNPVCDFKSWPAGMGRSERRVPEWANLLRDYHFASEEEALAYTGNPLDNLQPLAAAHIPIIHVISTEDEVVPIAENSDIFEARYRKLGGLIKVICHPGKHYPHGLEDSTPVIDFILQNRLRG